MAQILDLSTEKDRPKVKIDGVLYDIMLPDDLTLRDMLWMQQTPPRIAALSAVLEKDGDNEEAGAAMQDVLDRIARILLVDVPKKTLGKLKDVQKILIFQAYTDAVQAQAAAEGRVPLGIGAAAGTKFSPDSSDSTEDQPAPG